MEVFKDYLNTITNTDHKEKTKKVLQWVQDTFPNLQPQIKWNQPMFTHKGTFIVAFSVASHHLSFAPERPAMDIYMDEIIKSGYDCGQKFIRMPFDKPVNYALLENIIKYNIVDKDGYKNFWRA